MCSTPDAPDPPPPPPPAPKLPEAPKLPDKDPSIGNSGRDRRRGSVQKRSTILTSARGAGGSASTATKTLLGS